METTYSAARQQLAKLLDRVNNNREVVIINRRGKKGQRVALIDADELGGLIETVHLLRSPKNAQRLLAALKEASANKGKPSTVADLRREMGLD